jgi:3-methyladenine DNA glycosylase AlkD
MRTLVPKSPVGLRLGLFADLLPTLVAAVDDERIYVRKGASWAFRQIGKRSDRLRALVLDTVGPFVGSDSRGARWVARAVSRELLEQDLARTAD